MAPVHDILFNMHTLYSAILGVWAAVLASQNRSISGNFWGAILVYAALAGATTLVGVILALQGFRPVSERLTTYFLYMAWLTVIMPGLFSLLRGRDDRAAAIAFSLLAFFNVATSLSMIQRGLVSPWFVPA
jgi:hypothetical protein